MVVCYDFWPGCSPRNQRRRSNTKHLMIVHYNEILNYFGAGFRKMFNNRLLTINVVTQILEFDKVINAECGTCSKHMPEIS